MTPTSLNEMTTMRLALLPFFYILKWKCFNVKPSDIQNYVIETVLGLCTSLWVGTVLYYVVAWAFFKC